jgi:tetratricopeptide (TPR) repeat protein
LPENPLPSLHLAKVYKAQDDSAKQRQMTERAITINPDSVDAWAYLFAQVKEAESEEAAIKAVSELADAEPNKKSAAPFTAIQGILSAAEETRDKALEWAKKALERNPNDALALISLSALYGQRGDLAAIIALLGPHENKMMRDARLANNYFEALFQAREIEKVTKLLNALGGSQTAEVRQFANERKRLVAQFLQQQQQQLAQKS